MEKLKKRLLAMFLLSCIALCGCGYNTQVSSDEAQILLPEPETGDIIPFYGESDSTGAREITLHYVSEDRYALTGVTSAISAGSGYELIGNVLAELISASSGTLPHAAASGATLLGYEYSCNTVTVNLSIDSLLYQNEIETQLLLSSIANTLLGLDGVDAVNILVGGQAIDLARMPAGVYTQQIENVPAFYAQLESESDRFFGDSVVSIERSALMYFPSASGNYLLSEVRSVLFDSTDYVSNLIDALKSGPLTESAAISAVPANAELFNSVPEVRITGDGRRVIYLDFNSLMLNYLAFAGMDDWELYGSIVLTLTSFIPEIDAVCIMIDGKNLEGCVFPNKTIEIENGMVRRSDFSPRIGSAAELYFANESGSLVRKRCALSQTGAHSPKRLLESLIGMQDISPDMESVFPEGVTSVDVLGVKVDERIANVNLSANFYARCQSLDIQQERNLVYAMINTLAELENIGAVRFFIEGNAVDTLTDSIYLKTALLPDHGLVAE